MGQKYFPQLDGLRAIAVFVVLVFHCFGENSLPGGHLGVDLFFVISGYLITTILLKEHAQNGTISIKDFYIRRALRIGPAMIAVAIFAAIAVVAIAAAGKSDGVIKGMANIVFALTSTMNWARALDLTAGGLMGHTWSLSVEEQFYLAWPIALSLLLHRGVSKRPLVTGLAFLVGAVLLWRITLTAFGAGIDRVYNGTDTRADGLLIGCIIALVGTSHLPKTARALWWVPTLVLAGFLLVPTDSPMLLYGGFTIIALCAGWIVALAVNGTTAAFSLLEAKPTIWLGKRSYSLYLWHYPILIAFMAFGLATPAWGAVVFVLSILVSDLSYRFIERPFLAMKDRRSSAQSLSTGAVAS